MGKFVAGGIVAVALLAGAAIYYLQVYAFYEPVAANSDASDVKLTGIVSGTPEPILIADFQGIDANSSPLRYRACFTVQNSIAMLTETFEFIEDAVPLEAPGWFECFDADAIGAALEAGEAFAFLGVADISDGVDRVVAVLPDGRGYSWHQLNEKYKK